MSSSINESIEALQLDKSSDKIKGDKRTVRVLGGTELEPKAGTLDERGPPCDEWLSREEHDRFAHLPTEAWDRLHKVCPQQVRAKRVNESRLSARGPCPPDKVRFVCLSDTHRVGNGIEVPPGDVLIHAGDFTLEGGRWEVRQFIEFLSQQPHKHKIVIAGNHDLPFDPPAHKKFVDRFELDQQDCQRCRDDLSKACTYLEDSSVEVEGYKIYGSPWQPTHAKWAFTINRGKPLREKWDGIPGDVDLLVTHGPPLGYGDAVRGAERAGCLDLLETVKRRVRPLYHIYGHIHEGYGVLTDHRTTFINAAVCDVRYRPKNKPIVLDLPRRQTQQDGRHPPCSLTSTDS